MIKVNPTNVQELIEHPVYVYYNYFSTRPPVPWLKMLTSVPVLAITVTHLCSAWQWYLVAVNMPLFLDEVFHLSLVSVSHLIQ